MENETAVKETSFDTLSKNTGKTIAVLAIVTAGVLAVGAAKRKFRGNKAEFTINPTNQ